MNSEHYANVCKGTFATLAAWATSWSLERVSELAAIFAHIGTGLAGLATAIYTIYWLIKGRKKPSKPEQ